jgi:hypothetical protein
VRGAYREIGVAIEVHVADARDRVAEVLRGVGLIEAQRRAILPGIDVDLVLCRDDEVWETVFVDIAGTRDRLAEMDWPGPLMDHVAITAGDDTCHLRGGRADQEVRHAVQVDVAGIRHGEAPEVARLLPQQAQQRRLVRPCDAAEQEG